MGRRGRVLSEPRTVREFCQRILEAGDLATKLAPPRGPHGGALDDARPGLPLCIDAPAREPELALRDRVPPLPKPAALTDPAARARCLARFAHHELMAVELFAWALLRWPELPAELRRAMVSVLAEEQEHCRLYLGRLAALGSGPDEHPCSGYFWKHASAIAASPRGPRAFLCAMGLTFEQANLDFTLLYRDAFRTVGDEDSARVCQRVHDDEVEHVRLAARWLHQLGSHDDESELDAYTQGVPFPLSAARAKGRRFDAAARRRAGLSEVFIEHVRTARSGPELAGRRRGS